jgi:4-hydroxy-tetrahydrodipicolinate reductase
MKPKLKVAQFGLGPIGIECVKLASSRTWARIVGAVDIDPDKVRVDLGELTGVKKLRGLRIVGSSDQLPAKPDLVFHTTVSRFGKAFTQIEQLARQGIDVVSSCEELVFPQLEQPALAAKLNRICTRSGARVVGTGVNPGFVMDFLPLCLTAISGNVRGIHVERVVDASTRRESLQRKIGSGLPPRQFRRLLQTRKAGHAGLKHSLALIAHTLGWQIDRIVETGHAIVATRKIRTRYLEVQKGETCGLHQRIEAKVDGEVRLTLDLKMYLDAKNPHDTIQIAGEPPINLVIRGGVPGDVATVAALVNTAPRLVCSKPGLRLITDLTPA